MMWSLAAAASEQYSQRAEEFYQTARRHAHEDEMHGSYEIKHALFPRAWLSVSKAVRVAQMLQLHRLDSSGVNLVATLIQPPRDWTDVEERRRVFWLTFCLDRFVSMSTGWPMILGESEISTRLPSSEDSFETGKSASTCTLQEALYPDKIGSLSALGTVIVVSLLAGRNLAHLQQHITDDAHSQSEFWATHRSLDSLLLNLGLYLPERLRIPHCIEQPNAVFSHMMIHALTICLHQAAADRTRRNPQHDQQATTENETRCLSSALAITNIMRLASHTDLAAMHVLTPFCIFVAARVLLEPAQSNSPEYESHRDFLRHALQAIRPRNLLTAVFLIGFQQKELARSGIHLSTEALLNTPGYDRDRPSTRLRFVKDFHPIYEVRNGATGSSASTNPGYGIDRGRDSVGPGLTGENICGEGLIPTDTAGDSNPDAAAYVNPFELNLPGLGFFPFMACSSAMLPLEDGTCSELLGSGDS
ncbi:fungal specific transcription factor domain-containing protein [Aspergillus tanneri]|uniref:Xylanolytic transcriptional activator regulatory domain-containing protein n=1 Tax=Aspergillus tanneri TaxID=1220188 RepID=A0A5M9MST7_9EURO|nr:uncharacterized protein ATNIH1004_002893 [Aspergillus tanneri]KAA8650212.1 hypothetical protein ATNIH1004_002893 [Aspergillus tanneri]